MQDSDKENQVSVRGARGRGGQLGSTGDSGSQVYFVLFLGNLVDLCGPGDHSLHVAE